MDDLPAIGITLFVTDRSMAPAELAREVQRRGSEDRDVILRRLDEYAEVKRRVEAG